MRHPLRGGIMHRAGARIRLAGKSLKTLRRSIFFTRPLMAHQRNALLESRAFFLCPAFEKAASGAPSGTKTARPAGQRPGRFQQSCGLLESARVPAEPGWRNGSSAPSPSGRDHASRERSHSPRGEVAKYAPQERFLHAPAGAPKKALRKRKASVCRETRSTYMSRPGFRRKAKERVGIGRKESSPSTAIWPAFSDSWQQI